MEFEERLTAVERALTESDSPPAALADAADATDRLVACETRLDDVERQVADLEAAIQAVRGYVGECRREDGEAERTAAAALAVAERVERRLDAETPPAPTPTTPTPVPSTGADTSDDDTDEGLLSRVRDAL